MRRRAILLTLLLTCGVAGDRSLKAASPASGTLGLTTGAVSWTGFAGPGVSDGETTCVEATNCDTFTLTIAPGDYRGRRVRFKIGWGNELNDFDVYVHAGSNAGPEVQRAGDGPPETVEENTFDLNRIVVAGIDDVYTVHVVYFAVATPDPYQGTLTLEDIPVEVTRTATFVKNGKTGIRFSRNRTVFAPAANQDVEPSARVDFLGNAYAGGIRGLSGGNDIWKFDLNPASPTYDPFLRAATPTFGLDGRVDNPAWQGQPDAIAPENESDLGGDGGGDLDIAVGFRPRPGAGANEPPTVATSSLVAANVSTQRSNDAGGNFLNNPAGNTTVPVDDRQWNEFLGGNVVYLGYREFTGLQATSKYYINRSDDGGLTYGPAVLAALGGNITGNIDVDQRDGTVYFCHQGPGTEGNKEVRVAVGQPLNLMIVPAIWNTYVAAKGGSSIGFLFPVCKVASDGTVYVAYSDGGQSIHIAHSFDQGKTWSKAVRVSDLSPGSASLFPWMETGDRPGSVAVAWYGADVADAEGGVPGNTTNANWKVFFASSLNATASNPTFNHVVASDHVIHGADISTAGFVVGGPNRNLADFFQLAIDPQGLAFIAYADDSNDFNGHTYVTHQLAGPNLHTGRTVRIAGKDPAPAIDPARPEVMDFLHDARVEARPPIHPELSTPVDIVSIDYGCMRRDAATLLTATMKLSGLTTIPSLGVWRMNFAANPTRPGVSDRAEQMFLLAETSESGARSFSYGTTVRNRDGSLTYTVRGPADLGAFDLDNSSVTVGVDLARLNALLTRGPIVRGTRLIGLRGSASTARVSVAGLVNTGMSDSTRGGTNYTITCQ